MHSREKEEEEEKKEADDNNKETPTCEIRKSSSK